MKQVGQALSDCKQSPPELCQNANHTACRPHIKSQKSTKTNQILCPAPEVSTASQHDERLLPDQTACLPPSVEIEHIGLVLNVELGGRRRDAASVQDPSVLHHSRAGVDPIRRQAAFAGHLIPVESHQIQLPYLQSQLAAVSASAFLTHFTGTECCFFAKVEALDRAAMTDAHKLWPHLCDDHVRGRLLPPSQSKQKSS